MLAPDFTTTASSLTSASASGKFRLDTPEFVKAYRELYNTYTEMRSRREALQAEMFGIDPLGVSGVISGAAKGAATVHRAVGGQNTSTGGMVVSSPGMLPAMLGVEGELATVLTNLHKSYCEYMGVDCEASQDIARAGSA